MTIALGRVLDSCKSRMRLKAFTALPLSTAQTLDVCLNTVHLDIKLIQPAWPILCDAFVLPCAGSYLDY
jgi:hypothetical protein